MTKEEYLKILKDSFKDFKFYEDGHYYECKGKKVGISVTTFIHEFCNEFNEQEMAEKVLEKSSDACGCGGLKRGGVYLRLSQPGAAASYDEADVWPQTLFTDLCRE